MPKFSKKAIFIKEYEAMLASPVVKAYICFCFDDEDSFEDENDECMVAELAVLKSSQYIFWGHIGKGIAIGNACSMVASI